MPPLPAESDVSHDAGQPGTFDSPVAKSGAVSTDMMQVVNYEEEFNTDLGPFLERNKITNLGFDYNVTAIMGPQSSGKSTLLNLLFGTSFRTMDEQTGRYQVTQGVWLGRDDVRGIVVMDLEGTDSRERGEDAASFERKSALFALALAEVLIVNVWTQDVGRFNAANLSLLKTVMELDLQLFFSGGPSGAETPGAPKRQAHKTRLLFVLRDHVSTPLERLESTLRADVDNIWNSIAKPEAAAGTEVTDYFDLSFFALPHKVLMANQFAEKALELRKEFIEGDMFLEEYRRDVAADGFATYAESVWGTIRDNKELDIPSQKEMLAHVRCEEISREAIDAVQARLAPLEKVLNPDNVGSTETVPDLFTSLCEICDEAIEHYDTAAFRYSKKVALLKGQDLREKLGNDCKALFDTQISIASQNAMRSFEKRLFNRKSSSSGKNASPWENWGTVSGEAKTAVLEEFDVQCAVSALDVAIETASGEHPLLFAESSVGAARKRLDASLTTELGRATGEATSKAREFCLKTFQNAFKPSMSTVLDTASEDVWDRTSEVAATSWEKTKRQSEGVFGADGLGLAGEELETAVEDDLKPQCLEKSMSDIRDLIGTPTSFLNRLTKRFEDSFRFDERGVPRTFGPAEDLDALFVSARAEAEKLVDLLGEIKLAGPLTELRTQTRALGSGGGDIAEPVVFEVHTRTDLRERLQRQAGAVFMEARRAQEAAKITTRVPVWLFILLIVLGWNELMAVFRSPVLFLLCAIGGPLLYVGYISDTGTVLLPAVRALVAPVLAQAQEVLDQSGAPPIAPPPGHANGTAVNATATALPPPVDGAEPAAAGKSD